MKTILILFISVLGLVLYVIGRGILTSLSQFFSINHKYYWLTYVLVQLGFIGLLFLPIKAGRLVAFYWLGIILYLFLFILVVTLIKLLPINNTFIKFLALAQLVLPIIIVIIGAFTANNIKITTYDVKFNKKVAPINVVLFADIHLGEQIGYKKIVEIVAKTNQLNPDLVLIPGDIFNGVFDNVQNITKISNELKKIKAPHGVYAVLGNHDSLKDEALIKDFCQKSNINLLQDATVIVDGITLVGRRDKSPIGSPNEKRADLKTLLKDVNQDAPIIVLDHQPFNIDEAIKNNIDLQVMGHSHNGQVFPGSLITNAIYKVGYGYQKFDDSHIIVTSGVGYWGPPIRIGTISEIVLIKLTS